MTERRRDTDTEGIWTSETLPLKVRRELMNREIRKVLADRNVAAASEEKPESDDSRPELRDK